MPNEGVGTHTALHRALNTDAFWGLSQSDRGSAPRGARTVIPAYAFLTCGVVAAAVYALDMSGGADLAAFAAVGLGAAAALTTGPIVHRVVHRGPWRLLAIAAVAFLVG